MSEPRKRNLNFAWCLIVGGAGFLMGFIGPTIFAPDANQGPLLGLLITGPLGLLMGGVGWFLSSIFHWSYKTQLVAAFGCCASLALLLIGIATAPKPEWPGRIYQIQVTKCSDLGSNHELILETVILRERQIKKEIRRSGEAVYSAGEITYAKPTIVNLSFFVQGVCRDFPVGFVGTYYVTNHPEIKRNLAVLEPVPEFAKEL